MSCGLVSRSIQEMKLMRAKVKRTILIVALTIPLCVIGFLLWAFATRENFPPAERKNRREVELAIIKAAAEAEKNGETIVFSGSTQARESNNTIEETSR